MRRVGVSLTDVASFWNLMSAAKEAATGHVKKESVARFICRMESEVIQLLRELEDRTYRPGPFREFTVHDPKEREIAAAPFRDRVVHHAVCRVIEPTLERYAIAHNYACRKGKGLHRALAQAHRWSGQNAWFLKLDVERFFASVDHDCLMALLERKFKNAGLLWLLDVLVRHVPPGGKTGKGLPVGNLTSQHFANYYLGAMDHYVKEELRVQCYQRYMDDLLFLANSRKELEDTGDQVAEFLGARLMLRINTKQTRLEPVPAGIPHLGFRIYPGMIRLQRKGAVRFARRVSGRLRGYASGELTAEELRRSVECLVAHTRWASAASFRGGVISRLTAEFPESTFDI